MSMFCNQCEQTAKGTGCDKHGVCGKSPEVAALQDIIVHQLKGIGFYANALSKQGQTEGSVDRFTVEALFTTVTNVNFDEKRLEAVIAQGAAVLKKLRQTYEDAVPEGRRGSVPSAALFMTAGTLDGLIEQAGAVGIKAKPMDQDVLSLRQLLLFGLKGMAAYADHAAILGKTDKTVFRFFHEALAALAVETTAAAVLTELCMRCGTVNIRTMEILDEANTGRFGHPQPTPVSTGYRKGPAIVITGHDLLDLEALLKQTEGNRRQCLHPRRNASGPRLSGAEEIQAPGRPLRHRLAEPAERVQSAIEAAFLFTTNCIQKPHGELYRPASFTTGLVAFPGVAHVMEPRFLSRSSPKRNRLQRTRGDAGENPHDRVCPQCRARRRRQGGRGGQVRRDQALLPGRRLRRRETRTQLLHGIRGKNPCAIRWC
jgi:hydroxylamine reductase